jgi:GDPmannose 4,6-dehydratase
MKTAIITGCTGQDGAYLAQLLLSKGYKVYGAVRQSADRTYWRLNKLGIQDRIEYVSFELLEQSQIDKIIREIKPDEFYNLAAMSFVTDSFINPVYTAQAVAIGPLRILEAIRNYSPRTKFYQASSSEMFGKVLEVPQTEHTPFYPRSPYGVAKAFGHNIVVNYRESYDLFACSGILFNHESPLRGRDFITRKITMGLGKIANCINEGVDPTPIEVGNWHASRDWGHAKDYVEAMWLMLQQRIPSDYVIATGKTVTVLDFIKIAAPYFGFDIFIGKNEIIDTNTNKTIIQVNSKFYRPADVDLLVGNSAKAKEILGWKPKYTLEMLVKEMCEEDCYD